MVRILFILLICSSAFGQAFTLRDFAFVGRAATASGACVLKDSFSGAYTTTNSVAQFSGSAFMALRAVVTGGNYTLCKVDIPFAKMTGSASGSYNIFVATNDPSLNSSHGGPSAVVSNTNTIAASGVTGSCSVFSTTFTSGSIINGGTYWIVINKASDSSNFNGVCGTVTGFQHDWITSADYANWSDKDSNSKPIWSIYGQ